MKKEIVLMFGGGRQTMAILALIKRGVIEKPRKIVMSNTSYENSSTWKYKKAVADPLVRSFGMEIEVASHDYATVDLYAHNGDLLIPAFTATGKLPTFCSNEWKLRVCNRYIRDRYGLYSTEFISMIGFAFDEGQRVKKKRQGDPTAIFPLSDLMITTDGGLKILNDMGIPEPPVPSACWMCPNKANPEWRYEKETHPDDFQNAIALEKEIQEWDIMSGGDGKLFLHHSRVPLAQADLSGDESPQQYRACGLGLCMI